MNIFGNHDSCEMNLSFPTFNHLLSESDHIWNSNLLNSAIFWGRILRSSEKNPRLYMFGITSPNVTIIQALQAFLPKHYQWMMDATVKMLVLTHRYHMIMMCIQQWTGNQEMKAMLVFWESKGSWKNERNVFLAAKLLNVKSPNVESRVPLV